MRIGKNKVRREGQRAGRTVLNLLHSAASGSVDLHKLSPGEEGMIAQGPNFPNAAPGGGALPPSPRQSRNREHY